MVYVDDMILIDKIHNKVNNILKVPRQALKSKRFKLSKTKTEYLLCNFDYLAHKPDVEVRINTQVISRIDLWDCIGFVVVVVIGVNLKNRLIFKFLIFLELVYLFLKLRNHSLKFGLSLKFGQSLF